LDGGFSLLNGQSLASLKNALGSFCFGTLLAPAGAASRGLLLSAAGSFIALALLVRACASLAAKSISNHNAVLGSFNNQ